MSIPAAAGCKPLTDGEDSRTNLVASTIHSKLPELYHRSSRPLKKPVKYMECLKNHAAAIGGNATDGCGEFMAGGKDGTLEALLCSACCCHRNFHRKIHVPSPANSDVKKRFRTKFSQEQKEKMLRFAEKGGWKLQKMDDSEVRRFCHEIGIKRKVLKVWMHNNKYHFANKINTPLTTT